MVHKLFHRDAAIKEDTGAVEMSQQLWLPASFLEDLNAVSNTCIGRLIIAGNYWASKWTVHCPFSALHFLASMGTYTHVYTDTHIHKNKSLQEDTKNDFNIDHLGCIH